MDAVFTILAAGWWLAAGFITAAQVSSSSSRRVGVVSCCAVLSRPRQQGRGTGALGSRVFNHNPASVSYVLQVVQGCAENSIVLCMAI
jgi:hypothetical protein